MVFYSIVVYVSAHYLYSILLLYGSAIHLLCILWSVILCALPIYDSTMLLLCGLSLIFCTYLPYNSLQFYVLVLWSVIHLFAIYTIYLWIILLIYCSMVCHSYTTYELFYYFIISMVCHSYTTYVLFYYIKVPGSVIHTLPMNYSTTL